ncbi:VrrA/YqfQ family protein [Sporosarcina pasteurii]|uniref:YqfQ-like protein n=1 Tax=Sporosarcina pasteurii TaxID=1474 RepID=A0A380BN20_SPOPA|nr:VrrA/YqfQ family protein [Sporosarcina pasteurii]MDS9471047.1 VrrA/YqfQ family protein [Sporosarcina pasteurii]SUJ04130.1 Uncharacterised protein [Sporosarcina pasteurii]
MRYESFYPFAHNQPPHMRQQYSNPNMYWPPVRNQGQPPVMGAPQPQPQPSNNHIPGQAGGQGPSKLDAYMQTADRFLNTAQQFAPIVQQVAPMISNLPAMWRLYKGFQSMPNAGASNLASQATTAQSAAQSTAQAARSASSVPRIFQPPNP